MNKLTKSGLVFLLCFWATPAFASGGGVIKGTLKYHNALLHFCPNISESRNCSGSNYNESSHDVKLPVSEMRIVMRVNGLKVGESNTDANGNYQFSWYYPNSGSPTNAQLEAFLEHKDKVFKVFKGDGSQYRIYGNFTASYDWVDNPGNATGSIQNLNTWYWGSSSNPNTRLNTYHAAWRTWYYAFKYSGILLTDFYDSNNPDPEDPDFDQLRIRAGTSGSVASYNPNNHTISLPTSDLNNFSYQAIYHEMGHAASQRSSPGQTHFNPTSIDGWPSTTGDGSGHSYNSPEWSSLSFEEGFADFLGLVGHYWYYAPEPRACLNAGMFGDYCSNTYAATSSLGIVVEQNPTCTITNEARFQRNTTRFLWDYYDSVNETSDSISEGYWHFLDANNKFETHANNNGKNEPWNSSLMLMDDRDGRSLQDYRNRLWLKFSPQSSGSLYSLHCSPPGDY